MFLIISISIGLVATQAVLLFRDDKSSYILDLNASQAIKIAGEIQSNIRHLTEKMRIFSDAVRLPVPPGTDRAALLNSMLRQYPEFLLFSTREGAGGLRNVFLSRALSGVGLSVEQVHAAYGSGRVAYDTLTVDRPIIVRLGLTPRLSTFTLVVRGAPSADGAPGPVLIGEIPLERLYSAGTESRLFEIYVTDGAGRPLVAAAGKNVAPGAADAAGTFSDLLPQKTTTAGVRDYASRGVPMLAAYAPVGDLGLWTVVQIPRARALEASRRLVARSLAIAGVVCLAALVVVSLYARSMTRSLTALTRATEQIGQGQFDIQVPSSGADEIGALAMRFKRMTDELSARETKLQSANARLMESEKMTALGQLGAGIAHEVKNPLTSIRGYAQLGLRKVSGDHPLAEYFRIIDKETERSLEILKNLLRFSRQETAEMTRIDLNAVVADTVKLASHQLLMKEITLDMKRCEGPLPAIGNANQMEQVLLNLIINAGDAMESGGAVSLTTDRPDVMHARIRVADTGCGIPVAVLPRIFDPFFTTKPVGKGTGLGLSVSYGIVKEHKGEITAASTIGQGSVFTILIPLAEPAASGESAAAPVKQTRTRVISLR
jgi:signal transduction histidine kinase